MGTSASGKAASAESSAALLPQMGSEQSFPPPTPPQRMGKACTAPSPAEPHSHTRSPQQLQEGTYAPHSPHFCTPNTTITIHTCLSAQRRALLMLLPWKKTQRSELTPGHQATPSASPPNPHNNFRPVQLHTSRTRCNGALLPATMGHCQCHHCSAHSTDLFQALLLPPRLSSPHDMFSGAAHCCPSLSELCM